jgi:hypothetical protein
MPSSQQALEGGDVNWVPCPGCAGEIGVPPHWLAHTVACPKCGAIVSISETERVLWRPPRPHPAPKLDQSPPVLAELAPSTIKPALRPPAPQSCPNVAPVGAERHPALRWTSCATMLCLIAAILLCLFLILVGQELRVSSTADLQSHAAHFRKTRARLFGIEAEGNKFVYVFDRSASMGSGSGSPLASAKRELLKSLADLKETNQFQIIFYNEQFTSLTGGQQNGGLLFADRKNRELAEKCVRGIMADGGTRHGEPLEAALQLAPDVIFFLTDADQPELNEARLAKIRRMNGGGTSIHTIEFGLGAQPTRDNFLAKIARQNGGKYLYIDISKHNALKLGAARD